jgi:hypothetical protein
MAYLVLYPPDRHDVLPVPEVVKRLQDEFEVVDIDSDAGRDHVAGKIAATLRLPDCIPDKQQRLERLQAIRDKSLHVSFGDDWGLLASCYVIPDSELVFDGSFEVQGPARSLVERAAGALGYILFTA